jgi:dipeptidyl aminopeptidase/acylaminoacyl peptidase
VRHDDVSLPASIHADEDEMSLSLAGDKAVFVYSSFNQPPQVCEQSLRVNERGATSATVANVNDTSKPSWGRSESITWNNEGYRLQGWLLYPANYDAAKKYPLIVSIHGGPAAALLPHWPAVGYTSVAFSALDYFVFMPNPRGSYGEGEKFTAANRKDFGYGDLRDILAGLDTLEKNHNIDDHRIGITGWSYGGFMTMFAVTQTQRFKAAVAGAGISNWQSYYGENSIDQWMVPYFGATVYDDPPVYAKSSAINFIHQAKTPTLVVVGDRDGECPAPQSFEFWHALRAQGTPTELVVYPSEGHHFISPEHQRDVLTRALQWFQQYMP